MSEMKFTHWSCRQSSLLDGRFIVESDARTICDVCGPPDETQRANARLIAAAPELLEALEQIRDAAWVSESNSGFDTAAALAKCWHIALDAIHKAKGSA